MLATFGQPDSLVDCDALLGDAHADRETHALAKLLEDLVDHIVVARVRVRAHLAHASPGMHQDNASPMARANLAHAGVQTEGRYVVHDVRARLHGAACDVRLHRIDRNHRIGYGVGERRDDRNDPSELLCRIHRHGTLRAGRFAADVDDVGAFRAHPERPRDRRGWRKKLTPVAEAVGGHVHDAHDERAREGECAAPNSPRCCRLCTESHGDAFVILSEAKDLLLVG